MRSPHPWFWSLQLLPTFGIDPPLLPSLSLPFPCPIATCLRFLLPSFPPSFLPSPRYESYFSPPPPLLSLSLSFVHCVRPRSSRTESCRRWTKFLPFPKQLLPPLLPSFLLSFDLPLSVARRKSSTQPNDLSQIPRRRRTHKERVGERANAAVSACVTKSELRILIK